jgi:hypothetical protein
MIWVELALVNQAVLAGVDCFNDCYLMKDSRQDTAETDRYLFLLIVLEDLPFSIVRKDNFKKFTKSLSYKPFSVPFLMKMLHFVESDLEDHICDLLQHRLIGKPNSKHSRESDTRKSTTITRSARESNPSSHAR